MTTHKMYRYIGYNGTITSPVLLPTIDHLELVELKADNGKCLTDGDRVVYSVIISPDEVSLWTEQALVITE